MLPKKLISVLILVVVVFIGVGVWLGIKYLAPKNPAGPSEFSAVYLSTGDIYFGKLDWFPWPRMKNVWFLQRTVDQQNQAQLGVAPFASAFWGPVDEVYLNPKEIVLWTSLRNDSQLAQALANPSALKQAQPVNQGIPTNTNTNTNTKTNTNTNTNTNAFQGPTTPPPGSK
ncbi:MAG: hypothetical protein KGJ89_00010 [Patescibacteria group bacterium]|nr:hypothetical protein [Patescibacteria group bacterium]MDE2014906.1 hypothetical protein [Patescibacteria group bacterium]MDE2226335.1 hypothetical protein [Patescibacteria group bacterium]